MPKDKVIHTRVSPVHEQIIAKAMASGKFDTQTDIVRAAIEIMGAQNGESSAVHTTAALDGNLLTVTIRIKVNDL